MLAPIAWRVPPRHYGPWERVVSLLTEGLVEAGADVTLFATADSCTGARLSAVVPSPYEETPGMDAKVWEGLHLAHAFGRAQDFDLIHNHYDFLPLTYASLVDTPVVTTIHGFSSERILPAYRAFDDRVHYVSISDADRHPDLTYLATIHHGLDFKEFTVQRQAGEHLLFFGRIHPDKGAADAIRVARARAAASSWRASCRIGTTSSARSSPISRPIPAMSARRVRSSATGRWAARLACCTSSTSTNRSACPSWRRWPAARP